jgi:hypothetical protein
MGEWKSGRVEGWSDVLDIQPEGLGELSPGFSLGLPIFVRQV